MLFTDLIQSGCGFASGATGPFYCPQDRRVYIDLGFFRQLQQRLGAGGDFAEAYVIAHEVGHHVQNLLGITDRVQAARGRVSESEYNQLSVRLELQADFLAGVWARYADRVKAVVEAGDIEEAMRAASAVGDDRLQYQVARLRCARFIYARHVRTTRPLVPPRLRDRAISARATRLTRLTCELEQCVSELPPRSPRPELTSAQGAELCRT